MTYKDLIEEYFKELGFSWKCEIEKAYKIIVFTVWINPKYKTGIKMALDGTINPDYEDSFHLGEPDAIDKLDSLVLKRIELIERYQQNQIDPDRNKRNPGPSISTYKYTTTHKNGENSWPIRHLQMGIMNLSMTISTKKYTLI